MEPRPHMSEAGAANLQSITYSTVQYSTVQYSTVQYSTVHHLRRHVLQRAAHGHLHPPLPARQPLRQPEVDNPEVVVVIGVGEHDVEGLQVEVEDPLAVDVLHTSHYLQITQFSISQNIYVLGRGELIIAEK